MKLIHPNFLVKANYPKKKREKLTILNYEIARLFPPFLPNAHLALYHFTILSLQFVFWLYHLVGIQSWASYSGLQFPHFSTRDEESRCVAMKTKVVNTCKALGKIMTGTE